MASMKAIKQRMVNVKSTEQIIRAMNTIASTKLHRVRAQLEGVRPIYYGLKRQVEELGHHPDAAGSIFYGGRAVRHSLYIVLTSDRGFAGAYNSSALSIALEHMNQGRNEKILAIGAKGLEYFKRRGKNVIRHVVGLADSQVYHGSENLANWLVQQYLSGEADEMFMVYTHFENILSNVPRIERLLPISVGEAADSVIQKKFEPDLDTVIRHTIPLYVHMNLFRAFSESHTSEHAARMVSMDAAGKNASELIDDLSLQYNRERQAAITQELSEIVGGSNDR